MKCKYLFSWVFREMYFALSLLGDSDLYGEGGVGMVVLSEMLEVRPSAVLTLYTYSVCILRDFSEQRTKISLCNESVLFFLRGKSWFLSTFR